MTNSFGELEQSVVASGDWNDDIEGRFKRIIEEFKQTF
jgi:F-type H+/Na+-transporting ATPase subunit alpha